MDTIDCRISAYDNIFTILWILLISEYMLMTIYLGYFGFYELQNICL